MKKIAIFIAILLVLVFASYEAFNLADRKKIIHDILTRSGTEIQIDDINEVRIAFESLPCIIVDRITIGKTIELQNIKLPILALLNPDVNNIQVSSVKLYSDIVFTISNHDILLPTLFSKLKNIPNILIDSVSIINYEDKSSTNINHVLIKRQPNQSDNIVITGSTDTTKQFTVIVDKDR